MGDYGYVTLIPEVDAIKTSQQERKLPFFARARDHTPYYYSVELDAGRRGASRTEVTATDHCRVAAIHLSCAFEAKCRGRATRAHTPGFVHMTRSARDRRLQPDRMDAHLIDLATPPVSRATSW